MIKNRIKDTSNDQLYFVSEAFEQNTKSLSALQASKFDTANALLILKIITYLRAWSVLARRRNRYKKASSPLEDAVDGCNHHARSFFHWTRRFRY